MIPNFCIQRPVATTLLAIGAVLAGLAGYQLVPVAALPQVDFPTVNVSAQLNGASPQTMATSVATPLIKQFETIPGISEISASSSLGNTSIVLQFDLNRDIDAAAADVQAAISHATRQLPDNMTTPPSYRKTNPADAPVMLMSVQSDTMPRSKLDEIAEDIISPSLSTLPGVAEVTVFGAQTYAVRVEADPNKLQARSIGIDTVNKAIAAANNQNPVGTLQNNAQTLTINANTQRTNAAEFRSLVIASPNGAPIHLSDVADVQDSVANQNTGSWYDGQRGIILAIQRQPDANTVDVVDAINAKLPQLHAEIPPSVKTVVMNDAAKPIREAISDVKFTLLLTIGLVVLVIYLFTGHLTATIIPGLAVPLSLISTFGMMYVLGYSIDNIALGADARRRPRGRRRDRHARKYPAPCRERNAGTRSGNHRCGRGQLHDHLDVGFADRGLHPDPVDGRCRRARLQRIRDGRRHRHRLVGDRVADGDADARLQALQQPWPSAASGAHLRCRFRADIARL